MKVAEPTVERLIQYYRLLIQMKEEERKVVSSLQIGEILGIKASQVRRIFHISERSVKEVSDTMSTASAFI